MNTRLIAQATFVILILLSGGNLSLTLGKNSGEKKVKTEILDSTAESERIFSRETIDSFRADFSGTMWKLRKKDYGFSGGTSFGVCALNIKPVEDFCKSSLSLSNKKFSFNKTNYEPIWMIGGSFHVGLGGIRIGCGGMSGSTSYISSPYAQDSAIALDINLEFGGLLIQKSSVRDRWTYLLGGYVGAGRLELTATPYKGDTFFIWQDNASHAISRETESRFFYLQVHGGVTYSVFPLFHINTNVSVPMFYSSQGFTYRNKEYITVNPVLQFQFIFGNLG